MVEVNGVDVSTITGLTDEEDIIGNDLVDAVQRFAALPQQHPNEINEFVTAIHQCQHLLIMRIARRHYAEGWPIK